jgi:hypothetical protein
MMENWILMDSQNATNEIHGPNHEGSMNYNAEIDRMYVAIK